MGLIHRKSRTQQVLETVASGIEAANRSDLVPKQRAGIGSRMKTGVVAVGGLAGLTAASAAISSLRKSSQGASSDS
ncbi:MAG: hypothetical protein ABI950_03045 [Solirubrobacteraceae bacterium]